MSQNYSSLNEGARKNTSSDTQSIPNLNLGVLAPYVRLYVKNQGILLDSALKLDRQVNQVVKKKKSFFQLLTGKNEVLLLILKALYNFDNVIHAFNHLKA